MEQGTEQSQISPLVQQHIDLFACPKCQGALRLSEDCRMIGCMACHHLFASDSGVPLLFWPNEWGLNTDVTEAVRAFYEENPFPNYEHFDSEWSLREAARRGIFARLLDEQMSRDARVLEVGCGTGQLSNFLGMKWGRGVFGTDLCLNSLRLGQQFKVNHHIDNVAFLQMNLFRPVFKPESFDLIICNGVLHHTSQPQLGFETISALVKKGGIVIIGLYNQYGRVFTDLRRLIFKASGNRFRFLDSRLRRGDVSDARKQIWFMDQYQHPHESKHTIGQVLRWFDGAGIEFVNSVPKASVSESFSEDEELFAANARGSWLDHFIVQAGAIFSGAREGGFFVMIGRKGRASQRTL